MVKTKEEVDQLAEYLKKEILAYINYELNKGTKLSKIRNTLLLAGHHHTIIDEIIDNLKKYNFDFIVKSFTFNSLIFLFMLVFFVFLRKQNLKSAPRRA